MPEEYSDLIDIVEPLNIEARYPMNKKLLFESLTEDKCADLIEKAKELVSWIEAML